MPNLDDMKLEDDPIIKRYEENLAMKIKKEIKEELSEEITDKKKLRKQKLLKKCKKTDSYEYSGLKIRN